MNQEGGKFTADDLLDNDLQRADSQTLSVGFIEDYKKTNEELNPNEEGPDNQSYDALDQINELDMVSTN